MATLKSVIGGFAALALLAGGAVAFNATGDSAAYAQSSAKATVDSAIARGEIGEKIDGYLGVVNGASPSASVVAAKDEINIARKSVYAQLAQKSGQPLNTVAQLTGEKQIKKSAPGTYVKDATGSWKRK